MFRKGRLTKESSVNTLAVRSSVCIGSIGSQSTKVQCCPGLAGCWVAVLADPALFAVLEREEDACIDHQLCAHHGQRYHLPVSLLDPLYFLADLDDFARALDGTGEWMSASTMLPSGSLRAQ